MGQGQGQIVDIPGVGQVEFPADLPEDALNAAVKKLHDDAVTPPSFATAGMEKPSSLTEAAPPNQGTEFLKHAAQGINLPGMAKDAYHAVTNPRETYNGLVDQSAHNFSEFDRLVRAKDPVHAEMHLASALFPPFNMVTGPGDALREGKTGEGLGDAVATGLQGAILPKVLPTVRKLPAIGKAAVRTGAGLPEEAFSLPAGGAAAVFTGDPLKAGEAYIAGQKVHKLLGKLNTRMNPPGPASTMGLTDDAAAAARARTAQTPVGPRPMDIGGRVQSPPARPGESVTPEDTLGLSSPEAAAARGRATQAPFGPRPTDIGGGNRPPVGRTSPSPNPAHDLGLTSEGATAARTAETSAGPASVSRMRAPGPPAKVGEGVRVSPPSAGEDLGMFSDDAMAARARAAQAPSGPKPTDVGSTNRPPMDRVSPSPGKPDVMTGPKPRKLTPKKPASSAPPKSSKGAPMTPTQQVTSDAMIDRMNTRLGGEDVVTPGGQRPLDFDTPEAPWKTAPPDDQIPDVKPKPPRSRKGPSANDDAVYKKAIAEGKSQLEAGQIVKDARALRHAENYGTARTAAQLRKLKGTKP